MLGRTHPTQTQGSFISTASIQPIFCFCFLLADGFFGAQDCDRVEKAWVGACGRIGEKAVQIIDAVALADEVVGSVLGCRDGQVYRRMTQALESQGCYEEDKEVKRLVKELLK